MAKFKMLIKHTRREGSVLTEVGWGSADDKFSLTKDPEESFKFLVRNRKRLNLSHLFWFYWRDPPPQGGRLPRTFCTTAGLLKYTRAAKPAYKEFTRFTLKQR